MQLNPLLHVTGTRRSSDLTVFLALSKQTEEGSAPSTSSMALRCIRVRGDSWRSSQNEREICFV